MNFHRFSYKTTRALEKQFFFRSSTENRLQRLMTVSFRIDYEERKFSLLFALKNHDKDLVMFGGRLENPSRGNKF